MTPATGRLLDRRRCCLAVIDVQDFFLAKLPADQRAPLVARIAWLMRVALALEIPLLVTGEDMSPESGASFPTSSPCCRPARRP